MVTDIRGLELTGLDDNGVIQYEAMVQASYEYQPNIGKFIIPIIETYPDAPMPKVMQAYSVASEGRYTSLITVAQIAKDVRRVYNTATARERRHIDAITALSTGKIKQAIEIWDNILADWPLDLVAFRQMSLNLFWLGQRRRFADLCGRLMSIWDIKTPQYGFFIGPVGFIMEEIGEYELAEEYARQAVNLNASDMWAVHAVAHVMEMQGRSQDGIDWLTPKSTEFHKHNAFVGHLWWHLALFHLESGNLEQVLTLFDNQIYPKQSDFYLDVQNAASLLTRLEFMGVDTGERWTTLLPAVTAASGDYIYDFTELHSAMVLARNGQMNQLRQLNDELQTKLSPLSAEPWMTHQLTMAIEEFHAGESITAAKRMAPIRYDQMALGGSHAQQDLLLQYQIMAYREGADLNAMKAAIKERLAKRMLGKNVADYIARSKEVDSLTLSDDISHFLQKVSG